MTETEALPAEQTHPEQEEMPFAVVQGEPWSTLPRDLYIPPDALEVFLDAFEGPLDLLLYLINVKTWMCWRSPLQRSPDSTWNTSI